MEWQKCLRLLSGIGEIIRKRVFEDLNRQAAEYKSSIYKEGADDIIYQIDKDVEDLIVERLERSGQELDGIVLIAEGIEKDGTYPVFPMGMRMEDAKFRIIIDPIDGTRGLMYNKRPAFFLAAAAPNRGHNTSLADIEAVLMMELPIVKNAYADSFSALKGGGVKGWRTNLFTGNEEPLDYNPSKAPSIYGGFGQFSRFFSPGKEIISAIEEEMISSLFPDAPDGKAFLFEDQYISSGGQFYELLMGHDRFTADIRASLYRKFRKQGRKTGLTCHPYDICTKLALEEAGILITGIDGKPLNCRLDTLGEVDWIGYANKSIRDEVEPVLQRTLKSHGLL